MSTSATSAVRRRSSTARCGEGSVSCWRSTRRRRWRKLEASSSAAAIPRRPAAFGWARLPALVRYPIVGAVLVAAWHVYAVHKGPLFIATPWQTVQEFWDGWRGGSLAEPTGATVRLLLQGVGIGAGIAAVLTAFATLSKFAEDVLLFLTSVLNHLPGVAVLPIAMLIFDLSEDAIRFVIVNATIWPIAI